MPNLEAKYLIKLAGEDKARPILSLATVEHPAHCVWLELTQCSGDVLLVSRDRVEYILLKEPVVYTRVL
jgi:hypothetical protein